MPRLAPVTRAMPRWPVRTSPATRAVRNVGLVASCRGRARQQSGRDGLVRARAGTGVPLAVDRRSGVGQPIRRKHGRRPRRLSTARMRAPTSTSTIPSRASWSTSSPERGSPPPVVTVASSPGTSTGSSPVGVWGSPPGSSGCCSPGPSGSGSGSWVTVVRVAARVRAPEPRWPAAHRRSPERRRRHPRPSGTSARAHRRVAVRRGGGPPEGEPPGPVVCAKAGTARASRSIARASAQERSMFGLSSEQRAHPLPARDPAASGPSPQQPRATTRPRRAVKRMRRTRARPS